MEKPLRSAVSLLLSVTIAAAAAGCGDSDDRSVTPRKHTTNAGADGTRRQSDSNFRLERVGSFDQPLYVMQPPGDSSRLFVVEKTGRIKIVRGGKTVRQPFLSLRGRVSQKTEQGLLSLAFAPDYVRSRRFYISWTDRRGDLRVAEYRTSKRSPERVDRSSRRFVLKVRQPTPTHNGGHLLFGPDDLLYIGLGDGGGVGDPQGNGQDRSTLLGKLLRIDPRKDGRQPYRVPTSNPFLDTRNARDEIYAYGLRNPWRFSFDRKTEDLYIGDVGQDRFEEVNLRRRGHAKGTNFGWSIYESEKPFKRGRKPPTKPVMPMRSYRHKPACSVTGGYVVRDGDLKRMYGRYLYGDFCDGKLRSLKPRLPHSRDVRYERVRVNLLSSFGEDNAGHIYAVSLNGPVYQLVSN